MARKLRIIGLKEYEGKLLTLESMTTEIIGKAVYQGAATVADAVKAGIESIPIDTRYVTGSATLYGITPEQKQGLRDGFGIAKMRNDGGYMNVKLGFDGYNDMQTDNYPGGQPNSLIARSVNAGTYFRQRYPFIDNAVANTRRAAEQKMAETAEKAIEKVMK